MFYHLRNISFVDICDFGEDRIIFQETENSKSKYDQYFTIKSTKIKCETKQVDISDFILYLQNNN